MTVSRRFKAGCLLTLLSGFCAGIGFVLGLLAQQAWKKKTEDPATMKWAAMRHLDRLEPTPEQRRAFEPEVDAAIAELEALKAGGRTRAWEVIDRAAAAINAGLTPEQKAKWEEIRPKRGGG